MTQYSDMDLGSHPGNSELANKQVADSDSDTLFHLKKGHVSPTFNSRSLTKFDHVSSLL